MKSLQVCAKKKIDLNLIFKKILKKSAFSEKHPV